VAGEGDKDGEKLIGKRMTMMATNKFHLGTLKLLPETSLSLSVSLSPSFTLFLLTRQIGLKVGPRSDRYSKANIQEILPSELLHVHVLFALIKENVITQKREREQ